MQPPMSEKFETSHGDRQSGFKNSQNGRKNRQNSHHDPLNSHENLCNGHSDRNNNHRNSGNSTHFQADYNKPLQIIGMAKKAGCLAVGSSDAQKAVRAGRAKLIIFASDTSEGSVKRMRYEAERTLTLTISVPYTKFEFSRIIGRGSPGTFAVLDLGLAESFVKRLAAIDMTCYGEIAGLLRAEIEAHKLDSSNRENQAGKGKEESKEYNVGKARKTQNKAHRRARRADNRRTKI